MKKVSLFIAVVAITAIFSSCKKDYTCECTSTYGGISTSASVTAKMTKKDAKEWCEGYNVSSTVGGVTSSTTCKLK